MPLPLFWKFSGNESVLVLPGFPKRALAADPVVWQSGLSLSQTFNPLIEANTTQANLSQSLFVEANEWRVHKLFTFMTVRRSHWRGIGSRHESE